MLVVEFVVGDELPRCVKSNTSDLRDGEIGCESVITAVILSKAINKLLG